MVRTSLIHVNLQVGHVDFLGWGKLSTCRPDKSISRGGDGMGLGVESNHSTYGHSEVGLELS